YRYMGLQNGRTTVELLGDEVHRGPMFLVARRQRPLMGMQAGVFGQQRGVDIQQPTLVVLDEAGAEDAHESSQDHQVRGKGIDQGRQGLVVADSIRVITMIEHGRSEEHTSELQSRENLVCRLLLE